MTDKIIVFVTCDSKEEAVEIAHALINEKLAACVTVVPAIWSCYVWEGKLMWSDELLMLIKTTRGRFEQLRNRIIALHSYELPEIVAVSIEIAHRKYLDWIDRSVGG